MNFVAVGLALAIFSTGQDVVRVEVHNTRASKIASRLAQMRSLTEPTVAVEAKDEQGVLELKGPANDVESIKDLIRLFDVAPKKVRFDYEVTSPLDKLTFNGSVTASNQHPFGISEGDIGFEAKFTPRINEDGTVTVRLVLSLDGAKTDTVFRIQNGATVTLPAGGRPLNEGEAAAAKKPHLKVKVSF